MYECGASFAVEDGAAFLANNMSVLYSDSISIIYCAFVSRKSVQILSFNEKLDQLSYNLYIMKKPDQEKPLENTKNNKSTTNASFISSGILMQAKLCQPTNRNAPILVILTTSNTIIIDVKTQKTIFSIVTSKFKFGKNDGNLSLLTTCAFSRGISCIGNIVATGSSTGEIYSIICINENQFQLKKVLKEHDAPITDIATCAFDLITVSGDVGGTVVIWSKSLKQSLTVLNILRKQVICGTYSGQVLLYAISNGMLMAVANAHCRQITAISVALESAYILTASEDSYVRLWKLRTRKPDAFRIEFRHSEQFENAPIVGADFYGRRGNGFIVSSFDDTEIFLYKVNRKYKREPENLSASPVNVVANIGIAGGFL